QDMIACTLPASRFAGHQDGREARRGHVTWRRNASGFEEGGGEVGKADEILDDATGPDLAGPGDSQRHVGSLLIQGRFAARKRPAVVARDDDKSVFELAQTLQHVEQLAGLAVEALHGPIVIADVFAHGFAVRKIRGDADVIEFHSAPEAALPFVLAVRGVAAGPESKTLRP